MWWIGTCSQKLALIYSAVSEKTMSMDDGRTTTDGGGIFILKNVRMVSLVAGLKMEGIAINGRVLNLRDSCSEDINKD